jgi:hypothetical protein
MACLRDLVRLYAAFHSYHAFAGAGTDRTRRSRDVNGALRRLYRRLYDQRREQELSGNRAASKFRVSLYWMLRLISRKAMANRTRVA